jgi:pilus assembly protein Flp/PilA
MMSRSPGSGEGVMIRALRRLLRNERGTTAIEYAIIAAGVSVTIIAAVNLMGASVKQRYETVYDKVSSGN